jgi:hypothetical protein
MTHLAPETTTLAHVQLLLLRSGAPNGTHLAVAKTIQAPVNTTSLVKRKARSFRWRRKAIATRPRKFRDQEHTATTQNEKEDLGLGSETKYVEKDFSPTTPDLGTTTPDQL